MCVLDICGMYMCVCNTAIELGWLYPGEELVRPAGQPLPSQHSTQAHP